ncbi:unnamed protein product [Bemisia tabaci]|uniref:SHSP domain-containing protein n=1 Tax=Bemisia tabaci TaxID=7038 RepID=A0A9P0A7W7_BEMTA|nr:unnamed protein product [Bemisia tabaci]
MAQPNFTPIAVRGNFLYDPYFASARSTIQQLVQEMQKGAGTSNGPGRPVEIFWPPDNMTNLMAIISQWQQAQASIGQPQCFAMPAAAAPANPPTALNTIFFFDPINFQMFVDVRGFHPSEIKLSVSCNVVEVRVCHEDCEVNVSSANYASRTISKIYRLPRQVVTEKSQCSLSNDGTLILAVPWLQQPPTPMQT